jgi:sugar O-acyltransferase (sialic acid O-acetyltransferase NeuD family)
VALPLVVLGAVGNCLDIVDAVRARKGIETEYELCGFLDDDQRLSGAIIHGLPVLGPLAAACDISDAHFVCGIGSPSSFRNRPSILARLNLVRERFATVVHPAATISPSARLGRGTAVLAGCVICANVTLGDHVLMLPNCVVGHDTVVGDSVIFAAGVMVSGSVSIGRSCYLGTGSAIRNGISLGAQSLLGMGAVLVGDAGESAVLAGNPARSLTGRSRQQ